MTAPLPLIREIMATDLVTLSPDQDILAAMDLLIARRLSGAPVVDGEGRLVGMLSKKDCFRAALNASYHRDWGGQVADYMVSAVETLDPEMDVIAATEHFLASPYRRFPVMRGERMVGMVSRLDLLRSLAGLWR